MGELAFRIIQNEKEAKAIWELFSPNKTIDDEWDFRYAWMKYLEFPLHFIVGYNGNKPVGLLALQQNTLKGFGPRWLNMSEPFLEFFGGVDTDNNCIFLLPGYESYVGKFLEQINQPTVLTSLREQINTDAVLYADKFMLDFTSLPDFPAFLQQHFDGKSRQRLINRLNKLDKRYRVEIKEGSIEDLELLFQFNKERFGESSTFHYEYRRRVYQDLASFYEVDLFVILLDGVIKAISFGVLYKETYVSLNMGYDYYIRDLGKFVGITQIQRALQRGYSMFDAGIGNSGWKEQLHLTKIPQYKLILNCAS